jgi:hypothetical protein
MEAMMSKTTRSTLNRLVFACAVACLAASLPGCKTAPPAPAAPKPQPHPAAGMPVSPEEGKQVARENARAQREAWQGKSFEQFAAQTYREPFAGGKYIVNGDTPVLNEKQLREFFERQIQAPPATDPNAMQPGPKLLVVNTEEGQDTIWNSAERRQITYCVSNAFGTRYTKVVADMASAGGAWAQVADVRFVHVVSLDASCNNSTQGVVFDVRPVNVNGQYLARAFFPNEPRASRNVLIDESAFQLNPGDKLTLVGVLRHELGHTLGFRHEHTRPDSGTCFEDNNWRPLTNYDPFSVMHYPQCNGRGDWSLALTNLDQQGAACIYSPAPGFNVDPNICPDFDPTAPAAPCQVQTETLANQRVTQGGEMQYGPYSVMAGTRLEVRMLGNGPTGDPDLYVRFGQRPTQTGYACRPYADGANETCAIDVPGGQSQAFVMVRGYTVAQYHLIVTRTPGGS